MNKSGRWIVGAIVTPLMLFGLFMTILWKSGLFNFTGTEASAKIVASALALVGGLFGSLVTVLGIFLQLSLDQRNADLKEQAEERLRIDSERNTDLREEAEKRLNMEAAIQAVQLLGSESGKDVPVTQRAGVLFSLTHLGLLGLAITMLAQMLEVDRIDAATAAWVTDQALESNNETMQLRAARILRRHHRKFLQENGQCSFPESVQHKWNKEMPVLVREQVAESLLRMIIARPYSDWDKAIFNSHIVTLSAIWRTEPHRQLKNGVGICLEQLISVYDPGYELVPASGKLSIDDLRSELSELHNDPDFQTYDLYRQLHQNVSQWLKNTPTTSVGTSNAK